jgi:hypothetical protein
MLGEVPAAQQPNQPRFALEVAVKVQTEAAIVSPTFDVLTSASRTGSVTCVHGDRRNEGTSLPSMITRHDRLLH